MTDIKCPKCDKVLPLTDGDLNETNPQIDLKTRPFKYRRDERCVYECDACRLRVTIVSRVIVQSLED